MSVSGTSAGIGIRVSLDGAAQVESGLRGVQGGVESLGKSANTSVASLKQLGAAFAAAFSVREAVQAADAVTSLNNTLKLATGSATAAANAYAQLFDVAQRSRVSFAELASTYASLSRAGNELGVSQQRMIDVTEAVGNAMAISGGSAASMQAALVQLGQAMASGVLRGDELNSVMEQAPRLAKALADGIGVSIGQLRSLGAEGKITADQVVRALESQSSVLRNEVGSATMTVSQSWTMLGNAVLDAVGKFDQATGASAALAKAISGTALAITEAGKAFSANKDVIMGVLGGMGGAAVAAGILRTVQAIGAARAAFLALSAAMAANPLGLALLGIGVVTGVAIGLGGGKPSDAQGLAREIEYQSGRIAAAEKQLAATGSRGELTRGLEERIASMRKTRDAMQAELAAMQAAGIDTRAEDARLAAHTARMREQKKAEEDLDKFRQKSSGLPESYFENMREAIRLNQLGLLTGKEWTDYLASQQKDALKKLEGGDKAPKIALPDTELAGLRAKLADAQAYQQRILALGADAEKQSATEIEALKIADRIAQTTDAKAKARLTEKLAIVQQTAALERMNESMLKSAQAHQALIAAEAADAESLTARAAAQEKENAAFGKGKAAIEELTTAELQMRMAQAQGSDRFDEKYIAALERKIKAQKRWTEAVAESELKTAGQHVDALVASAREMSDALSYEASLAGMSAKERQKLVAIRQIEIKYAKELADIDKLSAKTAEQEAKKNTMRAELEGARRAEIAAAVGRIERDEARRTAEDINRSLTDALMRGFESGKDFARNLRDTVVNMFKTLVLRPVISAVINPVAGAINGVVSTGLSALGIGGEAAKLVGLSGAAEYASSAAAVASNIDTLTSIGFSASEAAAAATAAGKAAGAAAGVGFAESLSAIPGWGWALGGVALLGSVLGGRGETRSGASYAVGADGRAVKTEGPSGGEINGDAVRTAIETTVTTINGVLKSLGSAASVSGFVAGLESSKNGKGFVFAGGRVGDTPFGESAGRAGVEALGNLTAEQAVAALALDLKQATIQALQAATDIPQFVREQLQGINAEALTDEAATALIVGIEQQVAAIDQFRSAVQTLPFDALKNLSLDAAAAMAAAAGGIANLASMASALQNFANNTAFYTQEEINARDKAALQARFDAYGVAMPTDTSGYRAMVEGATAAAAAGDARAAAGLKELLDNANTFVRVMGTTTVKAAAASAPVYDGGGGGGGGGLGSSSSALDAWKSATDAIVQTMKDLRETLIGSGSQSLAQLQAQFAIAVAQAKAGDLEAAKRLPDLARSLVNAGEKWSATAVDQARLTSGVLAGLSQTLTSRGVAAPGASGQAAAPGRDGSLFGAAVSYASGYDQTPPQIAAPPAWTPPVQPSASAPEEFAQVITNMQANNSTEMRAVASLLNRILLILTRVNQSPDALSVKVLTP